MRWERALVAVVCCVVLCPISAAAQETPCPPGMLFVPAGGFPMGSATGDRDRYESEKPLVLTVVRAFCIDKYEYPNRKGADPRVGITWSEAKARCAAQGKRLCTEAEWEKACKGPDHLRYPYGNTYDPVRCRTSAAAAAPSGAQAACVSGYGVYDMSGNVWEWTASRYAAHLKDLMVLRGGAWDSEARNSRCAYRAGIDSASRAPDNGLRCCRAGAVPPGDRAPQ